MIERGSPASAASRSLCLSFCRHATGSPRRLRIRFFRLRSGDPSPDQSFSARRQSLLADVQIPPDAFSKTMVNTIETTIDPTTPSAFENNKNILKMISRETAPIAQHLPGSAGHDAARR